MKKLTKVGLLLLVVVLSCGSTLLAAEKLISIGIVKNPVTARLMWKT